MFPYIFLLLIGLPLAGGMESGIIGGKEAKHHFRPYMASIQYINHHTCGGMLIRQDYVLTAAHCLNRNDFSSRDHFEVVLGAYNINKKEKSQQRIPVIKYIQHPMFERNKKEDCSYDKLLIKLKNKAKLNKFVKVMSLPKKNGETPANVKCYIAGWGLKTPKGEQASDVMQEVDSGSHLICYTKPQGIASYTIKNNCTNTTYPQVYVKISYFLPWIKNKIKMND